jgi:hypothetical protein
LAILKARKILSGLEKKGFVQAEGDRTYLILYVNGKKTYIRTNLVTEATKSTIT